VARLKRLAVLGSTGIIGRLALEVAAAFPDRFQIVGLSAGNNARLLAEQASRFRPRLVSLASPAAAEEAGRLIGGGQIEILCGPEGLSEVARLDEAEMVLSAVVGFAGLAPTLAAIEAGKDIALANKESLVAAGSLVMEAAAKAGVRLLPVDSEHSALFQSLCGHRRQDLKRIILTASGGPFADRPAEELARVTPAQALAHPNWDMGRRITIDSATMMNKGLEAIEAGWLFDLGPEQMTIQIHRQSIVHSAVEFHDGSLIAQMGLPDMRLPIAYALAYPARLDLDWIAPLDLTQVGHLTFEEPDITRFPCLRLALEAGRTGGSAPAVLNAADETAVAAFLAGSIGFLGIAAVIEETLGRHQPGPITSLEEARAVDAWARQTAGEIVDTATRKGK